MDKNLKYFMRPLEEKIIEAPAPPTFVDEEGNVLTMKIKVLPQAKINEINEMYRKRSVAVDKKGTPLVANGEVVWKTEKNNTKATGHLVAEALLYPNLKDPDLMTHYNCYDISEMALKVFSSADEYSHVVTAVLRALGLQTDVGDGEQEELKEAKN